MDFGSLIAWLQSIWKDFWFLETVAPYYEGIRVRFGKVHSELKGGLHIKIPFADKFLTEFVNDDTIVTPVQPLTTADLKSVSISCVVFYKVVDIIPFLTLINQPRQTISDITSGVVSELVLKNNYEDLISFKLADKITSKVQKELKEYGVLIHSVSIASISSSKSLNLLMEQKAHL